jgi:hypothetical protein
LPRPPGALAVGAVVVACVVISCWSREGPADDRGPLSEAIARLP